ncbi:phosphoglucomutase/phosphomannomutase alpha/beta/alpha domain I [Candidatus Vecturithrix granuli]|uniref:Phosphoglucomutase/phosphomannomutase alpha/beta/alpha domain I n=1 Tax=Vecturithrix granuli TaxID=1499967 RepID=A0A081C9N1_VECG1|nr:phosphoglucomutase/phosphomannomutase alpha/beta/alpha domain I [Candidatus Vecturithrix granuli]
MLATDFACAFGTYIESGAVVLGRDTRRAGERLRSSVIAGILATGVDLYDIGITPTPVLQYALTQLNSKGGISISGSSTGSEWKALRFFSADGAPLNTYQSEELLDIFHNGSFSYAPWNQVGQLSYCQTALQKYTEHLLAFLDVDTIRARQFKIVLDCGNGTASQFVESLFNAFGCEVIAINNQPSPDAIYTPLPNEKHTQAIRQLIQPLGADAGFFFNLDASSIVIVSDRGQSLGEEYTFALLTDYMLSQHPGKPVVTNVSTSSLIDMIAQKYGSPVSRCRIGQQYIIERMRSISAIIGGEGSGSAAFPDFLYGFDGIVSMGLILQMLAQRQTTLNEVVQTFPRYTIYKDVVRCPVFLFHTVLRRISEIFSGYRLDFTDGVKIFFDTGWLHIRPSRNDPLMRVIAESPEPEEADRLHQLGKTEVRKAIVA